MQRVTPEPTTDIELARQVDQICQRFEAAWLAGEQPQTEAFIKQSESIDRPRLLGELLRLEAGLRHDSGETVSNEEYLTRFPHETETVAAALQDVLNEPADGNGASRYVLLEEIGRGGMGAVYRATDRQLRRRVAVKVLLPEHRHVREAIRRLEEESRICGRLQHPGVPPVHELGRLSDGRPFLAMKLVEGTTLAERLAERPDPQQELPHWLGVFEQICQTIAYAHARGVIHRDLKPANVMVGPFGEVQIMDWGLAKRVGSAEWGVPSETRVAPNSETQNQQLTQAGDLLGTPGYLSPEQACGRTDEVDQRTDVFALGAMLCEILTGAPAYVGESTFDVIDAASRADLSDAIRRLNDCDAREELVELCRDCLAPHPDQRPRDATEVSGRMSAYLESVAERLQQTELAQARAGAERLARRRRRRLWIGSISVVLLLLVAIAAGSLLAAAHFRGMEADQRTLAGSNATLAKDNEVKRLAAEAALAAAEQSNRQAHQTLADMYCAGGQLAEDSDQMNLAVLWFCEAARIADGYDERRGRMNGIRALNALKMCPQPTAVLDRANDRPDRLIFHPGNRWLVIKPKSTLAPDVLWNIESGEVHRLPGEFGEVRALAWNPAGDCLAVGTAAGRVFVLDFPTLAVKASVDPVLNERMTIRDLEYSPSGSQLAVVVKGQVFVSTTSDYSARPLHIAETDFIHGVLFSPDEQHLVTLGADNVCRVYSLASMNSKPREVPHMANANLDWRICRPIFDASGRLVTIADKIFWTDLKTGEQQDSAAPSTHRTFQIVDVPERDAICVMNHQGAFLCWPDSPPDRLEDRSILSAVVHPITETLILGGASPELKQLAPGDDELRSYPVFSSDRILTMGISPDGQFLATSNYSNRIIVWKLPSATPFHTPVPAGAPDSCGWPRSDSRRVLIRRTYRNAQVHLLADGSSDGPPLIPDGILLETAWSADERSVVTLSRRDDSSRAAVIDVWDWLSGERRQPSIEFPVEPAADATGVARLAIRPAGDRIAYVARDGRAIVASLVDPGQWHAIEGHDYASVFAGAAFDGLILSTGTPPIALTRTGWLEPAVISTLDAPKIRRTCYSSSDCLLGLGLEDGVMRVNAETLEPIGDPLPHPSWAIVLAMSAAGKYVATTCNDGYLRVWDTQQRRPTCPPIRYWKQELALTPDGSLLIAPGEDYGCRVIDTQTGRRVCPEFPLVSPPGGVPAGNQRTSVSPDGRFIIIGGSSHLVVIDGARLLSDPSENLAELIPWCEIVSGHRFEQGRPLALTPEARESRWRQHQSAGRYTRPRGDPR